MFAGDVGDGDYWGDDMRLRNGCANGGYDGAGSICEPKKCAAGNGSVRCSACKHYPCGKSTVVMSEIRTENTLADDVTRAILPYVDGQYGN